MATLEIHDANGQVSRVRISRDDAASFGSDPLCDVVVGGPGVAPFHGRIRWSKHRYKIDAAPGASAFEVNGKKLVSSSLRPGDEIRIGACRIFVLNVGEEAGHGDRTVVQPDPTAGLAPPPPAPAAAPFHRMEMAPPSIDDDEDLIPLTEEQAFPPGPGPDPAFPTARSAPPRPGAAPGPGPNPIPPPPPFARPAPLPRHKPGPVGMGDRSFDDVNKLLTKGADSGRIRPVADPRARRRWFGRWDRPPGEERVLGSPMVIGLVGILVALVVASVLLRGLIVRSAARRLFANAVDRYEDGDDRTAIREFDRFLRENPGDPRTGKAQVLLGLARVRQHTGAAGTSWGNALKQAVAMVGDVSALPEFADRKMDLAELLRKIAEGLADRARDLADPGALADAGSALALHARLAGPSAASLVERSRVPAKLDAARAAIRRKADRTDALARMDAAIKAGQAEAAYAARAGLVRAHPDLAADRDLVARMVAANDLILRAVRLDTESRPAAAGPADDPLGPPTSVVYRLEPGRPAGPNPDVVYALADGWVFGLDAPTGAPLWQTPVGVAAPFPPVPISGGEPAALAVDARRGALIRIEGRTGKVAWRQAVDGPIRSAPLVLGNQVFQPVADGRLLALDLATGAVRATLHLGRPIAGSPAVDEAVRHLYLLADEGSLFVLGLDPLRCEAVEHVGHDPGTIPCAPASVGRFLVVPVNGRVDEGSWKVFVADESGTKLKPAQTVVVGGWTWATPEVSGPVIWSASDRGELAAYAIGLADSKTPLTPIARIAPSTEAVGPSFVVPRGERETWVASGLSGRYELDPERGKLRAAWTLGLAGPALAPPRVFGKLAVLTQQDARAPGASVWGVDAASGAVRWRTVVGARWPSRPAEATSGDGLTLLAADGAPLSRSAAQLRAGGFVEQPLPKAGEFRLPDGVEDWIEVAGATVVVPGPGADHLLVRSESPEWARVELPAPLGAAPAAWGGQLLIPGADGRAYLIDPRTGASAADPFVPPFDRSRPVRWRAPRPLDGDAMLLPDRDGTLRRLVREPEPRPRLVASAEVRLDHPPVADPASTGAAVLVACDDGTVRSLAARDLSPQGSWPLDGAAAVVGPVAVGGMGFAVDGRGGVLAFAPDGRRLWAGRIDGTRVVGPPALLGGSAWFLGRDGGARSFTLEGGSAGPAIPLDTLPAAGPLAVGDDLLIPAGVGTLRPLTVPAPTPAAAPAPGGNKP